MNAIRKLLMLVMAVALAAFALPGIAVTPNKHYVLTMVPGVADPTQNDTPVTATIFNDNPSGSNSQIGSFTVSIANNVSGIVIIGADPDPVLGGAVTSTPNSASVTGITPLKPGQSYTLTLHVQGCGDGNTWSATVWSGSNLSGGVYTDSGTGNETTNVSCGVVGCSDPLGGLAVSSILGGGSIRGPFNQDGVCSSTDTVNYFVTDRLTTPNGFLHVRWDNTAPDAVFFYVVNQALGNPPKFAWKTDLQGNPIYVAGQACFGGANALTPKPFGTLISDNGGKILKVDTSTGLYPVPTAVPFPIIIGPKPLEEYLMVTKVNGQTWTVMRGTSPHVHPTNAPVMSTPKVLLPNPVACFDSAGNQLASNACPYVPATPAQMCYVPIDTQNTYIFDIGDGYVKGIF